MCERKATFIQAIFRLDHMSQTVLKGMVEHAMHRMQDYVHEGEDGKGEGDKSSTGARVAESGDASEELIRTREMVRHLQEERDRLHGLVTELQAGESALQLETSKLQEEREQREKDKELNGGERDSKEAAAIAAVHLNLQVRAQCSVYQQTPLSLCCSSLPSQSTSAS